MTSVKQVKAVANACVVLEAIAADQPVGVSQLARLTGLDKSAVHRTAVTFEAAGWLVKTHDGRWQLAPGISGRLREGANASLVSFLRPTLEALRDDTEETVILVAVEHDRLRVLDLVDSPHALRISPSGPHLPLRNSSAARAIAAHLPAGELEALRTVDPSLDDERLAVVRRRGWAINDREIVGDARVVGAPVLDRDGRPLAAVIVVAPTTRVSLRGMEAIGRRLAAAVAAAPVG